jgi:hypothetical protein
MKTLVKTGAVVFAMFLSKGILFSQVPSKTANAMYERAKEAIVKVEGYDPCSGKQSWQGTGFVVASDGKILTNYHVIRNSKQLTVRLANGDAFDNVEVMDVDVRRDIAFLKIKAVDLRTLQLSVSSNVVRGDNVLALGNPLGYEGVLSTGIISGFFQEDGFRFLLTTAPISPGSSGGPLLNERGEVIGITTATRADGQNLNFVVPIDYVRGMVASPQLPRPLQEVYRPEKPCAAPRTDAPSAGAQGSGSARRSIPDDLKRKTVAFLISKLGKWTATDALDTMGEPLEMRPIHDQTNTNVVAGLFSYPDPGEPRAYKLIGLVFGMSSKRMESFYLYPQTLSWDEFKKIWGYHSKVIKNRD